MQKSLTKRQLQAQTSRKKIYKASMMLINKKGFDNVTVEEISREACISKGLFYNYFPSKESVLMEYFHIASDAVAEARSEFLPGQTFSDRMRIFYRYSLSFLHTDFTRESIKTSYIYALKNEGKSIFTSKDRTYYQTLVEVAEYGQERGELTKTLTSSQIADLLSTHTWGFFFAHVIGFYSEPIDELMLRDFDRLAFFLRPENMNLFLETMDRA